MGLYEEPGVNYQMSVQPVQYPDGKRVIRITFANGAIHEFPAPRQDMAPTRIKAEHYLGGGGIEVSIVYPNGQVVMQTFRLEKLPPHEHP